MKTTIDFLRTFFYLLLSGMSFTLVAQSLEVPDDIVITCDFSFDADDIFNPDNPTFGKVASSEMERQDLVTTDRVDSLFCEEKVGKFTPPFVNYLQSLVVAQKACDFYNTLFDPGMPNTTYDLNWGRDGLVSDADSITIDTLYWNACFVNRMRRIFKAHKDGVAVSDTQEIFIIKREIGEFYINEVDIFDTTDCAYFQAIDTMYLADCTGDLHSKTKWWRPETGVRWNFAECSDCLYEKNGEISFRDSVIAPNPSGFIMTRNYTVFNWCTGDLFYPKDTFQLMCFAENLAGVVVHDNDFDCHADAGENGLSNWTVQAVGEKGTFTAITNAQGVYGMGLPPGDYELTFLPPSTYWSPCPYPLDVAIDSIDVTTVDVAAQPNVICPDPVTTVDLPLFRKCDTVILELYCTNNGTKDIVDGELVVYLEKMQLLTATSPFLDLGGNEYSLDIDTLEIGETHIEELEVMVSCDSLIRGEALCVISDFIFTDTCEVVESSIIVTSAECRNDSVVLAIENIGADMVNAQNFWIVEEDLIMFMRSFKLNSGEKHLELFPADGKTYFVIAENEDHLDNFKSISGIEGCTHMDSTGFSTGFLDQFIQSSPVSGTMIECARVAGPYDPNDKMSLPGGFGLDHEIFDDQELQYKIRFQNTGNDTAFNVLLIDTIDHYLDISSLQLISSSHNVKVTWDSSRAVKFAFPNIMLPDSNVNEPASHGFVRFRIKPLENLEPGTEINNHADIYFDFEEPVRTNTVQLRIFEEIITSVSLEDKQELDVDIFPNPNTGRFMIQSTMKELEYRVFNIEGKLIEAGELSDGMNVLNWTRGVPGVYSLLLTNSNIMEVHKIVVQRK